MLQEALVRGEGSCSDAGISSDSGAGSSCEATESSAGEASSSQAAGSDDNAGSTDSGAGISSDAPTDGTASAARGGSPKAGRPLPPSAAADAMQHSAPPRAPQSGSLADLKRQLAAAAAARGDASALPEKAAAPRGTTALDAPPASAVEGGGGCGSVDHTVPIEMQRILTQEDFERIRYSRQTRTVSPACMRLQGSLCQARPQKPIPNACTFCNHAATGG